MAVVAVVVGVAAPVWVSLLPLLLLLLLSTRDNRSMLQVVRQGRILGHSDRLGLLCDDGAGVLLLLLWEWRRWPVRCLSPRSGGLSWRLALPLWLMRLVGPLKSKGIRPG